MTSLGLQRQARRRQSSLGDQDVAVRQHDAIWRWACAMSVAMACDAVSPAAPVGSIVAPGGRAGDDLHVRQQAALRHREGPDWRRAAAAPGSPLAGGKGQGSRRRRSEENARIIVTCSAVRISGRCTSLIRWTSPARCRE
jgi:hypothetical protein